MCRFCKSPNFTIILDLGNQFLTGFFLESKSDEIKKEPLVLVSCIKCNLVQLKDSPKIEALYGINYGYRSGLNTTMVNHLKDIVLKIESLNVLNQHDTVLDIGSNDGTLLSKYSSHLKLNRIGLDPTISKFSEFYENDILKIPKFFSAREFKNTSKSLAKVITSIAMFYDLEDPVNFVHDLEQCLDPDGIWCFEQSYLPLMIKANSFDTICHEHLEYYDLPSLINILSLSELRIFDFEINSSNGGSILIFAKFGDKFSKNEQKQIQLKIEKEVNDSMEIVSAENLNRFGLQVMEYRKKLNSIVNSLRSNYDMVIGIGASTKGNVLLQFCELNDEIIDFIVDVNPDKFEKFTPGTYIKIVDEKKLNELKDLKILGIVLPWHFKNFILNFYSKNFENIDILFPLPNIEIYSKGQVTRYA